MGMGDYSHPHVVFVLIWYLRMFYYRGHIAGTEVTCAFRHAETGELYQNWFSACDPTPDPVTVPESDFIEWEKKWGFRDDASTEFGLSAYHICNALLKNERCIFHAAAFMYMGKAYLITAASGIGKSTQLKHLLEQFPDEIQVLNGDKPVIGTDPEGALWVFPSPWRGKEGWGSNVLSAPVAGVFILERGDHDQIRKAETRRAIPFLLQRILFTVDNRETVLAAAKIIEKLIETDAVWVLRNTGGPLGASIIRKTIDENRGDVL